MRRLNGITNSMDVCLSKFQEIVKDREAWHAALHGGHKESDMTSRLIYNKLSQLLFTASGIHDVEQLPLIVLNKYT